MQNLSMVCMHLTNYAVNKTNSNFQQPNAKSCEEAQDEGSKRSLHWFMNFVKDEHGETKANWLWKRIGTLCVRTVLSIMPTLSREYDQHFKSFAGVVPYKSPNKLYNNNSTTPSTAASPAMDKRPRAESGSEDEDKGGTDRQPRNQSRAPGHRDSDAAPSRRRSMPANSDGGEVRKENLHSSDISQPKKDNDEEDGGEGEDEEDDDDNEDDYVDEPPAGAEFTDMYGGSAETRRASNNDSDSPTSAEAPTNSPADAPPTTKKIKKKKRKIQWRGSRCFEILGYDIMIDSNFKPWLIEVNHLPRYV
jgi:hypothetical protein